MSNRETRTRSLIKLEKAQHTMPLMDSILRTEKKAGNTTDVEHSQETFGIKRSRDWQSAHSKSNKRIKVQSDDKFVCPVPECGASYTRRHNLKTHFKSRHAGVAERFPEVFQTLKSTKEGKMWKCPVANCICGYSRKGDLKFHFLRKHSELTEQFPEICKSKSSKSNKNYVCPVEECECGYMRKSDLRAHFQAKHSELLHAHPDMIKTSSDTSKDSESVDNFEDHDISDECNEFHGEDHSFQEESHDEKQELSRLLEQKLGYQKAMVPKESCDDDSKSDREVMEIEELTQEDEEAAEKLSSISTADSDEEPRESDEEEDAVACLGSLATAAACTSPSRMSVGPLHVTGNGLPSAFTKPQRAFVVNEYRRPQSKPHSKLSLDSILNHSTSDIPGFSGFASIFKYSS